MRGVVAQQVTSYLAGVQERLRSAELERVEALARAEEETKRRALSRTSCAGGAGAGRGGADASADRAVPAAAYRGAGGIGV